MLHGYIKAAPERAYYEPIEDAEPFDGEGPELKDVWATEETLEVAVAHLPESRSNRADGSDRESV